MRKLRNFIIVTVLFLALCGIYGNAFKTNGMKGVMNEVQSDFIFIKENAVVQTVFHYVESTVEAIFDNLRKKDSRPLDIKEIKEIDLEQPDDQLFSIYNVEIGDDLAMVEKVVGEPQRSTLNEYNVNWVAYHEDYHHFFMAAYDKENKVTALYTNQNILSSKSGIEMGTSREKVLDVLGEPLDSLRKGWVAYQIESNGEYDIFHKDQQYITVFYDKEEKGVVTAIQMISEKLEESKEGIYGLPSEKLIEGFEFQLFDLTNAVRVKHKLPILSWEEHVRVTARKHSEDMAEHQYFSHTNLQGESPFDRMLADDILFQMAGENIAMGQFSSIFAHEGLMNSPGHRENILQPDYESLGVGVAFNEVSQPYFTENFLTK